jgi:hypothetical protein
MLAAQHLLLLLPLLLCYIRFELRKDANAPPVNFPLPDGAVMPLQPAVKNREGDIFNSE